MDQRFAQLLNRMAGIDMSALNRYLPQITGAGTQAMDAARRVGGIEQRLLPSQLAYGRDISALTPQFLGQAQSWLNPPETSPIFQNIADRTTQGAAAANAMSGVAGPYAAGDITDALTKARLGFMGMAPQMASGFAGAGETAATQGAGLQSGALQNYLGLVGAPEQAALSRTLGNIGQATGLAQPTMQDITNYMGLGQSASQIAGQLGQQGFLEQQSQLGNLGGLFGGLLGAGPLGGLLYGAGGGAFGTGQGLFPWLGGLFGGGGGGGDMPGGNFYG